MADFKQKAIWHKGVHQLSRTDPVVGGEGGISNKAPEQLADRTEWLKEKIENLNNTITAPDGFKHIGQCESISQLRTIEPTEEGQHILVKAYYAGGTQGGGEFQADLGDSTTADNSGTVIVTAGGKRWVRVVSDNTLTLEDFGAVADGVTDTGEAIKRAFLACAYRYTLRASRGLYITNQELKAPSGLHFVGAGTNATEIKAGSALPPMSNLITNISNNYTIRTGKDRDIIIADIHFNAEWRGRYAIGTAINNQACGLKLSAVEACLIERVRVSNAALHCFDICADQYVATGNVTDNSANPSDLVILNACEAYNPYRDDAFTTHNCGGVVFNSCRAYFDGSVSELQNTQQGFEADEGSFDITFNNCLAVGFVCGYQSKGHADTMPARRVTFNDCLAVRCGYGFMASVGTNPTGKAGYIGQSVKFENCAVEQPLANKHVKRPYALYVYGADGVVVDGFTVNGDAQVYATEGVGRLTMNNLIFNSEILSGLGCIHIDSKVINGVIVLNGISSTVAQSIPLIAKTNGATRIAMTNIALNGKGENGIYLNRNARDILNNARNSGYTKTLFLSANGIGLPGDVVLEQYNKTWIFGNGAVAANQAIQAPQGTKMYYATTGRTWTQSSSDLNTPNWILDVFNQDRVTLTSATIGSEGNTARALVVNGLATANTADLDATNNDLINAEWFREQLKGRLRPAFRSVVVGSDGSTSRDLLVNGLGLVKTPDKNATGNLMITADWFKQQFSSKLAENGWDKSPSGLIKQWGVFNAENGSTFNFPIAFNECFVVQCTDENRGGSEVTAITVTAKSNTSFTIASHGRIGLFTMVAYGR